jgi:hypothetical protein
MTTSGTDSREWGCDREGGEEVAATKLRGVTGREEARHGAEEQQQKQITCTDTDTDTTHASRRHEQNTEQKEQEQPVIYTETAKRQAKDQEQ